MFCLAGPSGFKLCFPECNEPDCMLKECNLGNVVTDAMVFHYANLSANEEQWTDASIALQNSGSITASIAVNSQGTATGVLMNTSYAHRFNRHFLTLAGM